MKRIALHDADKTKLPKLALLKLAAYHKAQGDSVEWYMPLASYDVIYSSKVFSWTPESSYLPANAQRGGTPSQYRCYVLAKDVDDALSRIYFLEGLGVDPFAMPYRDLSSSAEPCRELKRLARWCNRPWLRKSCVFANYNAA